MYTIKIFLFSIVAMKLNFEWMMKSHDRSTRLPWRELNPSHGGECAIFQPLARIVRLMIVKKEFLYIKIHWALENI